MKNYLFALLLAAFSVQAMAQDLAPKKCTPFLMTVSVMQLGSQTIIFGCDSENNKYRALQITLNKKNEHGTVIGTVGVEIDSRSDESVRSKIEESIGKITDGDQSPDQARAMRKLVFKEMRQALDAQTPTEHDEHLLKATENLKAVLIQ